MKASSHKTAIVPIERIEHSIYFVRGHRVMLDSDLAALYGVTTARLNEQVKRNIDRFPADFMFKLNLKEFTALMSQIAISKTGRGGRRKLPYVFTEHGAVMLASVLNSPVAVHASIQVVRAFVRLREMLATHKELALKLAELEQKIGEHDEHIRAIIEALRQLMAPPSEKKRRSIGFDVEQGK
ncbi:ORF6N domain-containing protein [Candidatus Acetothermia bacterium]|nr:ORF6N domain-containing protein [Candidatus Acetothermia bacterium]